MEKFKIFVIILLMLILIVAIAILVIVIILLVNCNKCSNSKSICTTNASTVGSNEGVVNGNMVTSSYVPITNNRATVLNSLLTTIDITKLIDISKITINANTEQITMTTPLSYTINEEATTSYQEPTLKENISKIFQDLNLTIKPNTTETLNISTQIVDTTHFSYTSTPTTDATKLEESTKEINVTNFSNPSTIMPDDRIATASATVHPLTNYSNPSTFITNTIMSDDPIATSNATVHPLINFSNLSTTMSDDRTTLASTTVHPFDTTIKTETKRSDEFATTFSNALTSTTNLKSFTNTLTASRNEFPMETNTTIPANNSEQISIVTNLSTFKYDSTLTTSSLNLNDQTTKSYLTTLSFPLSSVENTTKFEDQQIVVDRVTRQDATTISYEPNFVINTTNPNNQTQETNKITYEPTVTAANTKNISTFEYKSTGTNSTVNPGHQTTKPGFSLIENTTISNNNQITTDKKQFQSSSMVLTSPQTSPNDLATTKNTKIYSNVITTMKKSDANVTTLPNNSITETNTNTTPDELIFKENTSKFPYQPTAIPNTTISSIPNFNTTISSIPNLNTTISYNPNFTINTTNSDAQTNIPTHTDDRMQTTKSDNLLKITNATLPNNLMTITNVNNSTSVSSTTATYDASSVANTTLFSTYQTLLTNMSTTNIGEKKSDFFTTYSHDNATTGIENTTKSDKLSFITNTTTFPYYPTIVTNSSIGQRTEERTSLAFDTTLTSDKTDFTQITTTINATTISYFQSTNTTTYINLTSAVTDSSQICPGSYEYQLKKCYKLVTTPKTFKTARGDCQSDGGDLVIINNSDEFNYVTEKSTTSGTETWVAAFFVLQSFGTYLSYWADERTFEPTWCTNYPMFESTGLGQSYITYGIYVNGTCYQNEHTGIEQFGYICELSK